VIIPSAEINFFGSVVHGIENIASRNGFSTLLYQSNELPEFEINGVDTFLRSKVDGIIVSIAKETTHYDHFLEIKNRGIPAILFDRTNDDLGIPSVVIDDYKGAYNATQHLINQGARRVAHICGQQHTKIFQDRFRGYVDAIIANGLTVRQEFIVKGTVTIQSGTECMHQLMDLSDPPDGVFAVEDFTALGAMQALKERGIRIPEDVAIIGFANEDFGKYITPSLSTVDQQTVKMGEEAAKLLLSLSKQENFYESPPTKIILEPKMIFRESSVRLKEP
jgi:LacI family transcriptional regulator